MAADVGELKFKPRTAQRRLQELESVVAATERDLAVRTGIFVTLGIVFGIAGLALIANGGLLLLFLGVIMAVLGGTAGRAKVRRKRDKVDFCRLLVTSLVDDFMPEKHARLSVDLRHYNEGGKLWWTGRSPYGNPKAKYTDKWMALSATLADGTEILVRRQAGVKTKSGAIQKEKRRLYITIEPNPQRYDLAKVCTHLPRLKKSLKSSVDYLFHNTPEKFHTHVDSVDASVKIKVSQEDTAYQPGEVVKLLRATMSYVHEFVRPGIYR